MRALTFVLLAALGAFALTGCGLGSGRSPSAVQLLVTRDFGDSTLQGPPTLTVRGAETVTSLLVRNYPGVSTRFGGAFVQSIGGVSAGTEGGQPTDWFYYVNGVEAAKGAAETKVHPGDRVWWDHHDWSQTQHVPAVIGAFPEPFLDGIAGKRLPVRVECAEVQAAACRAVIARMRASHVPAGLSALSGAAAPQTLRVRVGPWGAVGAEPVTSAIARGPRQSGVYVRFGAAGHAMTLLDRAGHDVLTLNAGAGLIAATREAEDAPVWVVTGTDAVGVELAANAFDPHTLAHRFALAVSRAGVAPLPIATAPAG